MKKNMRFYSIAALALTGAMTLAACSADDPTADSRQPAANDGTVTMTTTVSLADGSGATRALNADDGKKTFAEGDKIAFFYENTSGQTVKAESDALDNDDIATGGQTAAFTVTLSNAKAGGTVKYVYPAAMAGTADVDYSKLATQDGKLATLASTLDCATYSGNLTATGQLPSQPQLTNQLAVLALTLYDTSVSAANDVTAKVTKVTVKVGSDTYTVNRAATAGPVYVAVKPAANAAVSYTATTSTGEYKKEQTGKKYEAGYLYKLKLQMTPSATDLSMVDCAGDARATMTTANCYMVHKKGDYKLPLVYGNAIKNGAANSAAWTGVSGTNTTATFPNHAGNAINAPWITKSTGGTGVNKGMGIAVSSAELLWQDAQGLITKVGISGDYLTLTVGKDAATQEGNAVVAAKAADGTIVWSWHIWVTEQTFASNTLTTIATDKHTYTVTPVNLGWVGAPVSRGYCTYYQWGRKDAFIPAKGGGDFTDHTVYNISNATVTGMNHISNTTATIADNIKNPSTLYTNSETYGPCKTKFYNMWDAQQTGTGGDIATPTKKTVYDPSPAGFCVPTSYQLRYLYREDNNESHEWVDTNMGIKWKKNGANLFYPTTASRRGSDGGKLYVGGTINTNYWSATSYDNDEYGYTMSFHTIKTYDDGISSGGSYRQNGCPVRAVVEE